MMELPNDRTKGSKMNICKYKNYHLDIYLPILLLPNHPIISSIPPFFQHPNPFNGMM